MADKFKEIGAILAAARREQNKSLKDASEGTKIMEQYLVAIEAGQSDKLPSQAYFQLFARSYAQFLGIDPGVFDQIEEKADVFPDERDEKAKPLTDHEKAEAASQAQAKKFGRSLIYIIVTIIVIFVAFVLYNIFFVKNGHIPGLSNVGESTAEESSQAMSDSLARQEIVVPDTPYQPPEKLKLRMVAKQEVWAVVVKDGDTVLNRRLDPGDQRQWEADYRYNLTIGISTAVDLYVDGEKLAPLTDRARTVAGLEINQVNYKSYYPLPVDSTDTASTAMAKSQTSQPRLTQPTPPTATQPSQTQATPPPTTPPAANQDTTTQPGKDSANGN